MIWVWVLTSHKVGHALLHAHLVLGAACLQQDVKKFMAGFQISTESKLYVWLGPTYSQLGLKLHKHLMYSSTWV